MKTEKPQGPKNTIIKDYVAQSCVLLAMACTSGILLLLFLWMAAN